MWQRTAIRIGAGLLLFALLVPAFVKQFRQSPREAVLIWAAGCVFAGVAGFTSRFWMSPQTEQTLSPKWGYGVPKPWRWVTWTILLLVGFGLFWWSFRL